MHTPPLTHGALLQETPQRGPTKPSGQAHLTSPDSSEHTPPFRQGREEQGVSVGVEVPQVGPEKPGAQTHTAAPVVSSGKHRPPFWHGLLAARQAVESWQRSPPHTSKQLQVTVLEGLALHTPPCRHGDPAQTVLVWQYSPPHPAGQVHVNASREVVETRHLPLLAQGELEHGLFTQRSPAESRPSPHSHTASPLTTEHVPCSPQGRLLQGVSTTAAVSQLVPVNPGAQ